MSALTSDELRKHWIANGESLDRKGHFEEYPAQRRFEILKKGYLGLWRPDEALKVAYDQADRPTTFRTQQFVDDMRALGFVGAAVLDALLKILAETPPERYRPPRKLGNPPGYPFIFHCGTAGREVYFKFQIEGSRKKPRVLFWSCHPPVEEEE